MPNKLSKPLFLHIIRYFIIIFILLLVIRLKVVGPFLGTWKRELHALDCSFFYLS
jgi:hypothetical protein